jgi:hypothetical protein
VTAEADEKTCAACGRRIAARRRCSSRGAGAWAAVRHCSAACSRSRPDPRLEAAILALLAERPRRATICPSEAARRVDPAGWRALLEPTRAAARRLVAHGRVEITQGGRIVDPSRARGPIRVRLRGPA